MMPLIVIALIPLLFSSAISVASWLPKREFWREFVSHYISAAVLKSFLPVWGFAIDLRIAAEKKSARLKVPHSMARRPCACAEAINCRADASSCSIG